MNCDAEPASAPDTKSPRVFFFSYFRAKRCFCEVLIGFWRRWLARYLWGRYLSCGVAQQDAFFLFEPISIGETKRSRLIVSFRNGSGKHDCIALLSGGRDSSYVLAYVKLRPFALTVNNRFMPYETMQNIDNAVRILGVKYMYVR